MAERRMFTKKITDDDNFIGLSASAQALYLQLSMSADDDGFCNQVSASMFKAHASVQDLESLLSKRYLFQFENGVIVIKHWRMANALRKDRYTPTVFQEELKQLKIKDNGAYTLKTDADWLPNGCQMVAEWLPQDRLGKDSKDNKKRGAKRFVPPTLEEVKAYADQRGNKVDAQKFFDYYTEGEWKDSKGNPVKSWKQKMITWETKQPQSRPETNKKVHNFSERQYDYAALEKEFVN